MGKLQSSSLSWYNSNCVNSITPWLTDLGYQNCFISAAFVGMAASSVFLIMIFFGKGFRVRSAARYRELVAANTAIAEGK
jgi:hypothetical protein